MKDEVKNVLSNFLLEYIGEFNRALVNAHIATDITDAAKISSDVISELKGVGCPNCINPDSIVSAADELGFPAEHGIQIQKLCDRHLIMMCALGIWGMYAEYSGSKE